MLRNLLCLFKNKLDFVKVSDGESIKKNTNNLILLAPPQKKNALYHKMINL